MASMLPSKFRSTLLLLSIMLVSLLSTLPSGIGQTNLTTVTLLSTSTLPFNSTGTFSTTLTNVTTVITSLTVSQTSSVYSTYNSTSTPGFTATSTLTSTSQGPSLPLILDVLAAAVLIFVLVRFWKRRQKRLQV